MSKKKLPKVYHLHLTECSELSALSPTENQPTPLEYNFLGSNYKPKLKYIPSKFPIFSSKKALIPHLSLNDSITYFESKIAQRNLNPANRPHFITPKKRHHVIAKKHGKANTLCNCSQICIIF